MMSPSFDDITFGLYSVKPHDHVFRNQIVGSTLIGASSGPRLQTVILMRIEVASAFAYSMNTSKYLLSLKMPVSSNSNSGSFLPLFALSSLNLSYGNSCCGYLYS